MNIYRKIIIASLILLAAAGTSMVFAGTLTCTVTSACSGGGVVVMNLATTTGGHAELTGQPFYNQFVCCSGVVGLSNSCGAGAVTLLNLQNATNSHVEEAGLNNYTNPVCLSVVGGGSVTSTYQSNNCSGYDTSVLSLSANTNAHVGIGTSTAGTAAYPLQVCATATGATVTCTVTPSATAFGTLSTNAVNTSVPSVSTTISCGDGLGCTLDIQDQGNGVSPGLATTTPAYLIASANATLAAGTEGYGVQATSSNQGSGGPLNVAAAFNVTGNVVGGLSTAPIVLASSTATFNNWWVVATHLATISPSTEGATYKDTITYSCLGN